MIGLLVRLLFGKRRLRGSDDPRMEAFVRGLVMGALVGAALAGSSLWGRRNQSRRQDD
jgi:hypothetical protein